MTDTRTAARRVEPKRVPVQQALVSAAQQLIASDGTGVSIQVICERAGVAPGSLYNYFDGKDELFVRAAESAIEDFQTYLAEFHTSGMDPLEQFTMDVRLYGRMPESHPLYARVLTRTTAQVITMPHGYRDEFFVILQGLVDQGRIRCDDLELTLIAAFAAFERLVALRLKDPEIGPDRVDDLAAIVLTWFGVPKARAHRLATRPLPHQEQP